jgi:hypothetical protein
MVVKKGPLDEFDRQQLFKLLKESVKANSLNAKTNENIEGLQKKLGDNMTGLNDHFVLHRANTEDSIKVIKDDLIKYIKRLAILVFVLLGGILVSKALGLDLVSLIKEIGT